MKFLKEYAKGSVISNVKNSSEVYVVLLFSIFC